MEPTKTDKTLTWLDNLKRETGPFDEARHGEMAREAFCEGTGLTLTRADLLCPPYEDFAPFSMPPDRVWIAEDAQFKNRTIDGLNLPQNVTEVEALKRHIIEYWDGFLTPPEAPMGEYSIEERRQNLTDLRMAKEILLRLSCAQDYVPPTLPSIYRLPSLALSQGGPEVRTKTMLYNAVHLRVALDACLVFIEADLSRKPEADLVAAEQWNAELKAHLEPFLEGRRRAKANLSAAQDGWDAGLDLLPAEPQRELTCDLEAGGGYWKRRMCLRDTLARQLAETSSRTPGGTNSRVQRKIDNIFKCLAMDELGQRLLAAKLEHKEAELEYSRARKTFGDYVGKRGGSRTPKWLRRRFVRRLLTVRKGEFRAPSTSIPWIDGRGETEKVTRLFDRLWPVGEIVEETANEFYRLQKTGCFREGVHLNPEDIGLLLMAIGPTGNLVPVETEFTPKEYLTKLVKMVRDHMR